MKKKISPGAGKSHQRTIAKKAEAQRTGRDSVAQCDQHRSLESPILRRIDMIAQRTPRHHRQDTLYVTNNPQ